MRMHIIKAPRTVVPTFQGALGIYPAVCAQVYMSFIHTEGRTKQA